MKNKIIVTIKSFVTKFFLTLFLNIAYHMYIYPIVLPYITTFSKFTVYIIKLILICLIRELFLKLFEKYDIFN